MFVSKRHTLVLGAVAALALTLSTELAASAAPKNSAKTEEIQLWPGAPPGTEDWDGEEQFKDHVVPAGKIKIWTNVTVPTLSVFRPDRRLSNGTGVVILPGGAFGALAWDLEGTEIAEWLTERGITAFVLKYRVRSFTLPPGEKLQQDTASLLRLLVPAWNIAVEDGTQAVRLLRSRAGEYGIEPDRIGMIGFSAGAATTLGVTLKAEPAARPDFAVSVYGMLMDDSPVPADAPPVLIVATQEDATVPAASSTKIFSLWTESGRQADLHIFANGEHGFGMRPNGLPVDHWPDVFEDWLESLGLLEKAHAEVDNP